MTAYPEIEEEAARIKGLGDSAPRAARDPVNLTAIRTWLEALGGQAPGETVLAGDVAPPAMIQVWTMPGLNPDRSAYDPLWTMIQALDRAGYTSIVATNCDQEYLRYL